MFNMTIVDTLDWLEELYSNIDNGMFELWDTIEVVLDKLKTLKSKQPYHINVIDELHISENANSRILTKLFQYQNEAGRYEILESLVSYIQQISHKEAFSKIRIVNPVITQEEERIDIWVRDSEYAIIFENKIYDASDQEAQLARYIKKTNEKGYSLDQIFVLYMPSTACEPSPQTWILKDDYGNEVIDYMTEFECRYLNLPFREHILPWLKNVIIPNVRQKDCYLLNALNQYVDYLEGMFFMRKINNKLNMEIQELLTQKLHLNECITLDEKYDVLDGKIKDIKELLSQMEALKDNVLKEMVLPLIEKTKKKHPNIEYIDSSYIACKLTIDDIGYELYVALDSNGYYCQLERKDKENLNNVYQLCRSVLPTQGKQTQGYKAWKYCGNVHEAFELFDKTVNLLLS